MKAKDLFKFKCVCHASMKKEKRFVEVHLSRKSSKVKSNHCSCPVGNSGYCNHIMDMFYEIADYSLHSLKSVPLEFVCTSKLSKLMDQIKVNWWTKLSIMKCTSLLLSKFTGISYHFSVDLNPVNIFPILCSNYLTHPKHNNGLFSISLQHMIELSLQQSFI